MNRNKLLFCLFLIILILFSTYIFGYRVIILALLNTSVALLVECVLGKKKLNTDLFITSLLYTLVLPPHFPFILSVFGISFGIFIGKLVYGGSGYNIFNPALVGRVFLHVSFNKELTTIWTQPVTNAYGGFTTYLGERIDVISNATPLLTFRWSGEETSIAKLFWGMTEGSIGETSAALIILIGVILLLKKIISKEIVFSIISTFLLLNCIGFYMFNWHVQNPINALFSGGLLFGTIFMATDPVTSPKSKYSKYIYGITIGVITFSLRTYASFAGGIMFAILFGNMITPILDIYFNSRRKKEVNYD